MKKIIIDNKIVCTICKKEKNISFFPKDKNRRTGHILSWCNECKAKKHRDLYKKHPETFYTNSQKWISQNPQKRKAHTRIKNALKTGKIIKPIKCEGCKMENSRIEAHHWLGYDKEHVFDVRWLCHSCHELEG